MKNKINVFLNNRKDEINENGLLYCLFAWLMFSLFFVMCLPFLLVYLLNECTKYLFRGAKYE